MKEYSWQEIEDCIKDKDVYIWGWNSYAEIMLTNDLLRCNLQGVIDLDSRKQGVELGEVVSKITSGKFKRVKLMSDKDVRVDKNTAFLVMSMGHVEEICESLQEMGAEYVFCYSKVFDKPTDVFGSPGDYFSNKTQDVKINKKKIVFYSNMMGCLGHGKAIAEKLHDRLTDYEFVWIDISAKSQTPSWMRHVPMWSKEDFMFELKSGAIWIGDYCPDWMERGEDQIHIDVKHWASITLKGIPYSKIFQRDYVFIGSDFDRRTCKDIFHLYGEYVDVGSPRSDILFTDEGKSIRKKLGISESDYVILYAPTFRDSKREGKKSVKDYIILDIEKLQYTIKSKTGRDCIVLVKLHPVDAMDASDINIKYGKTVLDTNSYNDSQELVAAADALITDYSSIMFEPAFVRKPVFLFAPDREEYVNKERALLLDYNTLPFDISETNESLMETIRNFDYEKYVRDVDIFMDKYGVHEDGRASNRAAEFICGLIAGENKK